MKPSFNPPIPAHVPPPKLNIRCVRAPCPGEFNLFAESRSSRGPGRSGTTLSRQPAAGARMPCYAERVIMRSIAAGALRFLCVGGQFATSLHVDSSA
jgi:hypothetical protein